MARILKMKDIIKLTIGEVIFHIAPMTYIKKQELLSCTRNVGGKEVYDLLKAQALYLKYSLKKVEGIEDYNGDEYQLEFNGDELTNECVDEVLNLEQKESLTIAAWQLLNGVRELIDPSTGKELEGVKMEVESSGKSKSQEA